jgi:signal transduction histidine kinase
MRQVWGSNEQTTVDLVPLLERLLAEVRSTHPEVTVRADLPSAATVTAHPKLETALREVLRNAVEHNDTATLDVDVHVTETTAGTIEVRIADSGSGLPDIEQELFSGAEPSTSALDHGVGLGLWLVYWIVDQSGGDLSLANDDGAVVTLALPRGDGDTGPINPKQTLREHGAAVTA